MNNTAINEAIVNHRAWVMRLKTFLAGMNTERFDPAEISNSHQCEFGRWLNNSSDCFKTDSSKQKIEALHDSFHKVAADIAILIQEFDEPSDIEPYLIELESLSKELIQSLMQERS